MTFKYYTEGKPMSIEVLKDLGMRFPTSTSKRKIRYGLFKCKTCDEEYEAIMKNVIKADIGICKSCSAKTHGESKTLLYRRWSQMCVRKKTMGCSISKEWESSFECFKLWSEDNGYSDSKHIGRIDSTKGYSSDNCYLSNVVNKYDGEHGSRKHDKLYSKWLGMKDRCYRKAHAAYKYYGGKGVHLSDEWQDFSVFKEWSLANGYKAELTIERIDSDGDYCSENCEYITRAENSRRSGIRLTYGKNNAVKISVDEASELCEAYATGLLTQNEIAKSLGVTTATIGSILRPAGLGTLIKKVVQLTLDGDVVAYFDSTKKASESVGVSNRHINGCCRGEYKSGKGFIWKFV